MTLDDVRARRAELYEIAARHGVDRLSVVVAGPDVWLPYEAEAYIEVRFTPEAKQQPGGLWYGRALDELRVEMSTLLAAKVGIGDMEGESDPPEFGRRLQALAVEL